MSEAAPVRGDEVVCPHCNKPFEGELLSGSVPPYEGFKCPHCGLFVPRERAGAPGAGAGGE